MWNNHPKMNSFESIYIAICFSSVSMSTNLNVSFLCTLKPIREADTFITDLLLQHNAVCAKLSLSSCSNQNSYDDRTIAVDVCNFSNFFKFKVSLTIPSTLPFLSPLFPVWHPTKFSTAIVQKPLVASKLYEHKRTSPAAATHNKPVTNRDFAESLRLCQKVS